MKYFNCFIAIAIVCGSATVDAKDLGVIGNTYEIKEPDALEQIHKRLKEMEKTGEIAQKQKEAKERVINNLKNPKPIPGITTATVKRVRTFDPSMNLENDIRTDEGQLIAKGGTRINPLDTVTMSKTMVLFKGSDPDQVAAVKKLIDVYNFKIMPVLVDGSWYDLTRSWKRQVYYDQFGYISRRLEIKSVPAVVRQTGKVLEIQEIPAKELLP